jgi:hypothetical protein
MEVVVVLLESDVQLPHFWQFLDLALIEFPQWISF